MRKMPSVSADMIRRIAGTGGMSRHRDWNGDFKMVFAVARTAANRSLRPSFRGGETPAGVPAPESAMWRQSWVRHINRPMLTRDGRCIQRV